MVADRVDDVRFLPSRTRIVPPHYTLQFRELADHFGHEVYLCQPRCAFRQIRVRANLRRQFPRQRRHALNLVAHRAQLFLERDGLQLLAHHLKRRRLVLFPEEARI